MPLTPAEQDPTSTQTFGAIEVPADTGAPLLVISPQDRAAISALRPGSALLIVSSGPATGARFLLDAERTTVGRHPRADIFLDDVTVSRKHAVFLAGEEGTFTVRDSGSLNGTYVNRQRVDEQVLRAGDEVQIGKYRMSFYPAASAATASAAS